MRTNVETSPAAFIELRLLIRPRGLGMRINVETTPAAFIELRDLSRSV